MFELIQTHSICDQGKFIIEFIKSSCLDQILTYGAHAGLPKKEIHCNSRAGCLFWGIDSLEQRRGRPLKHGPML